MSWKGIRTSSSASDQALGGYEPVVPLLEQHPADHPPLSPHRLATLTAYGVSLLILQECQCHDSVSWGAR